MKALLDTHTFLWWITNNSKLSANAHKIISDGRNELLFSSASVWEIAIKASLGKIKISDKPLIFISEQMNINKILALPIQISHAMGVYNLSKLHNDPFDRMLISQAMLENLPILTDDKMISKYSVKVIW
jgi:PIN domain nuclease of toxin-antitoxin system